MEETLQQLSNTLNNKIVSSFEIMGVCNSDGILIEELDDIFSVPDNCNYFVSLLSLETDSMIPNIQAPNNKFYYSVRGEEKEIIFKPGGYDINDINSVLRQHLGEDKVKFEINTATGYCFFKTSR